MSVQHIVIVGGSSGIGLATARRLLAGGARVTITGRDERRLDAALTQLGGEARAVRMDAADAETIAGGFERIGDFDHLVLALGSGRGVGPFESLSPADVRLGFEEKTYAHFGAAQAALPFLNPTGSIVFVGAISSQAAVPGTSGIAAANAAVAALVPILAVELGPRRVNGVAPGVIDTPWWDAFPAEQRRAMFADFAARTPLGRIGQADDVAQAIAFLIAASFVTGQMLACDGGLQFVAAGGRANIRSETVSR